MQTLLNPALRLLNPSKRLKKNRLRAVVEAPELLAAEIADEENAVSDEETELMSAVSVEEERKYPPLNRSRLRALTLKEENTAELILMLPLSKKAQREEPAVEETEKVTSSR